MDIENTKKHNYVPRGGVGRSNRRKKELHETRIKCKSCKAYFDLNYAPAIIEVMVKERKCVDCAFKGKPLPLEPHPQEGKTKLG